MSRRSGSTSGSKDSRSGCRNRWLVLGESSSSPPFLGPGDFEPFGFLFSRKALKPPRVGKLRLLGLGGDSYFCGHGGGLSSAMIAKACLEVLVEIYVLDERIRWYMQIFWLNWRKESSCRRLIQFIAMTSSFELPLENMRSKRKPALFVHQRELGRL